MKNELSITMMLLFVLASFGCETTNQSPITTIAFSSCAKADQGQEIWQSILATEPDTFLFIGDNVYVDVPQVPKRAQDFERSYTKFAEKQPGYVELFNTVPVYATWDDHDFGLNDAGKEFALKDIAQQYFIQFFELPEDSPVRDRPGVYDAHVLGPTGQRVQIILLDTRYFRDPLKRNPAGRPAGRGPYVPHTDGTSTLLGDAQWSWLEEQLKKPAELRIIASSIQFVNDESGWECWGNFPHEQQRLYNLISKTQANGIIFISGDRHLTELSVNRDEALPYPMWDLTSSGMRERPRPVNEKNNKRVGPVYRTSNFGLIEIDWNTKSPTITLTSHDKYGEKLFNQSLTLNSITTDAR